ncbi:hypothetical protein TNCV_3334131 [Trichonephila clavipes]|nr:hypothetical protein TNCV_3334131 [Trichonephila clavipes]
MDRQGDLDDVLFPPALHSYIIQKWKTQLEAEKDSTSSRVGIATLRSKRVIIVEISVSSTKRGMVFQKLLRDF